MANSGLAFVRCFPFADFFEALLGIFRSLKKLIRSLENTSQPQKIIDIHSLECTSQSQINRLWRGVK